MGSTRPCSEEYKIRVSILQKIGIMLPLNYTKDSIPFSEGHIQLLIIFLDRERMGSILVQNTKLGFFLLQIMLLLNYTKDSIPFSEGYIPDCLSFSQQGKNGFNPSLFRSVQLASFSPPCMIQLGSNLLQNETIHVIFSTGMNAKEEISSSTVCISEILPTCGDVHRSP
jgi:hypothetical protein